MLTQHQTRFETTLRVSWVRHEPCGGHRVVVSTAAFHARVRGSFPGLGGLKKKKMFLPHPLMKLSIVGSLRDREVACSASDRQGSNFESCVWRTVSSHSSHHPQEVLLAQFSLYVHNSGLKPDSFHFICVMSHDATGLLVFSFHHHGSSPASVSTVQKYDVVPMQHRRLVGCAQTQTIEMIGYYVVYNITAK